MDWRTYPETIPAWMLSEEGRNRVKQRHTMHPVRDAGDPERGEGSEQSAGEPPTRGVRGGVRPDIMILRGVIIPQRLSVASFAIDHPSLGRNNK